MTDAEHAVIIRRICDSWPYHGPTFAKEHAALDRAIELLEREANQVNYRDIVPPWAIDEGNPPHDPRR